MAEANKDLHITGGNLYFNTLGGGLRCPGI